MLLRMWSEFSRRAKHLAAEKALKNELLRFVYRIERLLEIPRKQIPLNMKLG